MIDEIILCLLLLRGQFATRDSIHIYPLQSVIVIDVNGFLFLLQFLELLYLFYYYIAQIVVGKCENAARVALFTSEHVKTCEEFYYLTCHARRAHHSLPP